MLECHICYKDKHDGSEDHTFDPGPFVRTPAKPGLMDVIRNQLDDVRAEVLKRGWDDVAELVPLEYSKFDMELMRSLLNRTYPDPLMHMLHEAQARNHAYILEAMQTPEMQSELPEGYSLVFVLGPMDTMTHHDLDRDIRKIRVTTEMEFHLVQNRKVDNVSEEQEA